MCKWIFLVFDSSFSSKRSCIFHANLPGKFSAYFNATFKSAYSKCRIFRFDEKFNFEIESPTCLSCEHNNSNYIVDSYEIRNYVKILIAHANSHEIRFAMATAVLVCFWVSINFDSWRIKKRIWMKRTSRNKWGKKTSNLWLTVEIKFLE